MLLNPDVGFQDFPMWVAKQVSDGTYYGGVSRLPVSDDRPQAPYFVHILAAQAEEGVELPLVDEWPIDDGGQAATDYLRRTVSEFRLDVHPVITHPSQTAGYPTVMYRHICDC